MVYLNIINFLLKVNIKIGKRLVFYQAKYSAQEEIDALTKSQKFDLRSLSDRAKNLLIYDQDIIDKRMDICKSCEHLFKPTGTCLQCGCFISGKVRVNTNCPVGKWSKEVNYATATN